MNQNTDSDLDELERQFTCDVGDWNEVQRRPNAGRQKNNRQNAAAAQRNDRTSSPNGAERRTAAARRIHRAHSPVTDFRGITILQTHAGSSPARKGSQTRMTNMIPMISMMRMHTMGRECGNKRAKKQRGKGRDSTDMQDVSTLARTSADYGAKRGRRDNSYDEFEDVNRRSDRKRGKGGASGLRIAIIVLAVVAVIAAGVLAYTLLNGSSIGG